MGPHQRARIMSGTDVRMIQNRPHVHLETLARVTKTPVETWQQWLLDPDQPSVHFARTQDGLFVEESSATVLVHLNLGPSLIHAWESFWNRTGRTRRRLTESEKKNCRGVADLPVRTLPNLPARHVRGGPHRAPLPAAKQQLLQFGCPVPGVPPSQDHPGLALRRPLL